MRRNEAKCGWTFSLYIWSDHFIAPCYCNNYETVSFMELQGQDVRCTSSTICWVATERLQQPQQRNREQGHRCLKGPSLKYTQFTGSYLSQRHVVRGVQTCRVRVKTKEHFSAVNTCPLCLWGRMPESPSHTTLVPLLRWIQVLQLSAWHFQGCVNSSQKWWLGRLWGSQGGHFTLAQKSDLKITPTPTHSRTQRSREAEHLLNT